MRDIQVITSYPLTVSSHNAHIQGHDAGIQGKCSECLFVFVSRSSDNPSVMKRIVHPGKGCGERARKYGSWGKLGVIVVCIVLQLSVDRSRYAGKPGG